MGKLLQWIFAFLTDRNFKVRVDNTCSAEFSITSGVLQGSVLGPLLFLLYIQYITRIISSKRFFYADDVKLYANPIRYSVELQKT